jgi:DNA polymerase III subunit epsilon
VNLPRPWRRRRFPGATAYAKARLPSAATPWREAAFAVVDLETTGLDPRRDEIISFASVPIDEGRIVVGGVRTTTIRPERMPEAQTIRIHGLREVDLADAPPLATAMELILDALCGRALVAHVAWVERGFLERALRQAGLRLAGPVLDTEALARHVLTSSDLPEGHRLSLSEAVQRLGLPVHRPHVAEGDALTTAQLFLALASHLERTGEQTVGSLARISGT